jgi:hypothetical protein
MFDKAGLVFDDVDLKAEVPIGDRRQLCPHHGVQYWTWAPNATSRPLTGCDSEYVCPCELGIGWQQ